MSFFLAPFNHSENKIKEELNLSIYKTKSDLKIATGIDTSNFAEKADPAVFRLDVDQLDIDKL